MSSKIVTIAHELADRAVNALDDEGWHELANELATAIAAPVVERQPVARVEIGADRNAALTITDGDWLRSLKDRGVHQLVPLYTAPPELAELQESLSRARKAHALSQASQNEKIDELQATIARLKADFNQLGERYSKLQIDVLSQDATARRVIAERDQLKAEIKRLKAGQGEPVLFVAVESIEDPECVGMHATRKANELQHVPLYTSQPAPVSKQEAATLIASYLAPGRSEGHVSEVARAILVLAG